MENLIDIDSLIRFRERNLEMYQFQFLRKFQNSKLQIQNLTDYKRYK